MTEEKKERESILDLPKTINESVVPLTVLDEEEREEFRGAILRRCTGNQLSNGLREAMDSYTFGRGDSIDDMLIVCYEEELAWRERIGWGKRSGGGNGASMDRLALKLFSLFIKRHSQYIFSSTSDSTENKRYT